MQKPDFPPLLTAGIHVMNLAEIKATCVDPFPNNSQRRRRYRELARWIAELRSVQVTAILWIDGSFVTSKPSPADIDCMMWNPRFVGPAGTTQQALARSLTNRAELKAQRDIDLYMESPKGTNELLHRQAYWKGMFGFQHDGVSAKGFVELHL